MAPGICHDAGRVAERKRIAVIRTRTQTGKSLCFCFLGAIQKSRTQTKERQMYRNMNRKHGFYTLQDFCICRMTKKNACDIMGIT